MILAIVFSSPPAIVLLRFDIDRSIISQIFFCILIEGFCWFCDIFNSRLHVVQNRFTDWSSCKSRTWFSVYRLSSGIVDYARWTVLGSHFLLYASHIGTRFTGKQFHFVFRSIWSKRNDERTNFQFAFADVIISGLLDTFVYLRRHKFLVTIGYCVFCYLLALPLCAPVNFLVEKEKNENFFVFFFRAEFIFLLVEIEKIFSLFFFFIDHSIVCVCRHWWMNMQRIYRFFFALLSNLFSLVIFTVEFLRYRWRKTEISFRFQQLYGRYSNDVGQKTIGTLLVLYVVYFRSDHHDCNLKNRFESIFRSKEKKTLFELRSCFSLRLFDFEIQLKANTFIPPMQMFSVGWWFCLHWFSFLWWWVTN